MKKNKQSFNSFIKNLPSLKEVDSQERLPSYFDMMWDIKYGYQLFEYLQTRNNPDIYAALTKHGYDAKKIKEKYEFRS